MKGKGKLAFERNRFKFSESARKTELGRRGTREVPAQHHLTMASLNAQFYEEEPAPIPEQKKEMGEQHMWGQTRDVLRYSWLSCLQLWAWFISSTKTMQKGLLVWKSNIVLLARSWE